MNRKVTSAALVTLFAALILSFNSFAHVTASHPNACGDGNKEDGYPNAVRKKILVLTTEVRGFLKVADVGSCANHDQCYAHGAATYCSERLVCDAVFLGQMYEECELVYTNLISEQACKFVADSMVTAVVLGGSGSFANNPTCSDWQGRGEGSNTICPTDADGRYSGKAYLKTNSSSCDVNIGEDNISRNEVRTGTIYNPFVDFHRAVAELDLAEPTTLILEESLKVTSWDKKLEGNVTLAVEPTTVFNGGDPFDPDNYTKELIPHTIGDIEECPCFSAQDFESINENTAACNKTGDHTNGGLSLDDYAFEVNTAFSFPPSNSWSCSKGSNKQTFNTTVFPSYSDLKAQRCEQLFRHKIPSCKLFFENDLR
jgi:hypothetical protein